MDRSVIWKAGLPTIAYGLLHSAEEAYGKRHRQYLDSGVPFHLPTPYSRLT